MTQRLVDLTFADTVFLTNSGAEAVNARSRLRGATQPTAPKNIADYGTKCFHGRTLETSAHQPKSA